MLNAFTISITYFLIVLLLFVISFLTGDSICRFSGKKQFNGFYSNLFFKCLLGVTAITIVVSMVYSRGKTINFIFLLIALFWMIENRFIKKENDPVQIENKGAGFNYKKIFALVSLVFVVFLWQAGIVLKFGDHPFNLFEKDNLFYAEISKCLINTGQENIFTAGNLINSQYHFPTPYHYFDLWLNGFVSKIFGLNFGLSLYLVTYTFFSTLFMFGLLSLMEKYTTIKLVNYLISFLLLFASGLYITDNINEVFRYHVQMEGIMERYGEKLAPVYCFCIGVVLLFINGNFRGALVVLLCLPLISISLGPAVGLGLFIFSLLKLFGKEKDKKFYFRLILYNLLVIISLILFYYLTEKNLSSRTIQPFENYTDLKGFTFYHIKFYLVELFLKCYAQPLFFLINYIPFVLVLVYLIVTKNISSQFKKLIGLFGFIWLSGLISFNTFYLLSEAWQFYTNPMVLWHVLFACFTIVFWYGTKPGSKIVFNLLAIICLISLLYKTTYSLVTYKKVRSESLMFSENYLNKVNEEFKDIKTEMKGAVFYDELYYKKEWNIYPYEYFSFPGMKNPKVYIPFNLTYVNAVPKENLYQKKHYLAFNPFNQYVNDRAASPGAEDILNLQIKFIKENNIKYLVCPAGTKVNLPDSLNIKKTIRDSLSGQSLIILN